MKDLELKDILNKQDRPLTKLSTFVNGRWSFTSLISPTKTTEAQNFYRIDSVFGLLKSGTIQPTKYSIKGSSGDYVAQDTKLGTLSLVTKENYLLLFPSLIPAPPATPPQSSQLQDPNFLTKIQQESLETDSDKVLIGNRTFSLPSTTKKTVSVIDTPTGQAKVFYDTSGGAVVYDYDTSAMVEVDTPAKPGTNY